MNTEQEFIPIPLIGNFHCFEEESIRHRVYLEHSSLILENLNNI
jgi:hypothetical protein